MKDAGISTQLFTIEYRWVEGNPWYSYLFLCAWIFIATYITYVVLQRDYYVISAAASAVTVLVTYGYIAQLSNSTKIAVSPHRLNIMHGPVPWMGGMMIEVSDLKSFHIQTIDDEGTSYKFYCLLKDGTKRSLFPGVNITRMEEVKVCITSVTKWLQPYYDIEITES